MLTVGSAFEGDPKHVRARVRIRVRGFLGIRPAPVNQNRPTKVPSGTCFREKKLLSEVVGTLRCHTFLPLQRRTTRSIFKQQVPLERLHQSATLLLRMRPGSGVTVLGNFVLRRNRSCCTFRAHRAPIGRRISHRAIDPACPLRSCQYSNPSCSTAPPSHLTPPLLRAPAPPLDHHLPLLIMPTSTIALLDDLRVHYSR